MSKTNDLPKYFRLSAGGLMGLAQRWMCKPESRALPIPTQILIAISLLWVPLAIVSLFEGNFAGDHVTQPFITDVMPHVRFLISVPLLLLADRYIDPVIHIAVSRLKDSGIVSEADQSRFRMTRARLHRVRDSVWPDVAIIVLAFSISWLFKPGYGDSAVEAVSTSWFWVIRDGEAQYSVAGWWYLVISGPMYLVILLRWIWRFLIWADFLFRVSRLSLVLRPSHPDLAGGLGYFGVAQQSFVTIFFAFATVASSTIAHDILAKGGTLLDARPEIIVLVVVFTAIIYVPLLFFSRQLFLARRAGLNKYGALGYKLSEAFDKKWFGEGKGETGTELLASSAPSAIADYSVAYENVRSMRPIPVNLRGILLTAVVLLVPFLPLTLTAFTLRDLLQRLADYLI